MNEGNERRKSEKLIFNIQLCQLRKLENEKENVRFENVQITAEQRVVRLADDDVKLGNLL